MYGSQQSLIHALNFNPVILILYVNLLFESQDPRGAGPGKEGEIKECYIQLCHWLDAQVHYEHG